MGPKRREVIIPKDKAVFWLDANGRWHNAHGPFEHSRIIRYFHTSIQKDHRGYFLCQESDAYREKVYFAYEDTALFVFEVLFQDPVLLVLNTGRKLILDPQRLYTRNDQLYLKDGDEEIKFTDACLAQLSNHMVFEDGQMCLMVGGGRYPIPAADD